MNKSEKFWDRISNNYDNQADNNDQTHIKTFKNIKKHLNGSDIVLDYGCATGTITNEIADNVKEIHGIDISSKMIQVAKRNAEERKIENVYFSHSTIFNEKYKKNSFNVILGFNILHLLEDTEKVMQRINELLKPGGIFISATACMGDKKTLLSIFLFLLSKIGIVPYIKKLKISELEDLITNENFQIVETEKEHQGKYSYFIAATKI